MNEQFRLWKKIGQRGERERRHQEYYIPAEFEQQGSLVESIPFDNGSLDGADSIGWHNRQRSDVSNGNYTYYG